MTSFDDWNSLAHHGIKGQKWGIRRYQNKDGSYTEEGKRHKSGETLFVSGSSKTQDKNSPYRRRLPKFAKSILKASIREGDKIIIGDAPGIDRQVQDFLKKKKYDDVEVYGPGKKVRYSADPRWKTNPIDDPDHPEGSKEWLAKKDRAMTDRATKGLAVILDEGSSATRNNVRNLINQNKKVRIYELSPHTNPFGETRRSPFGFKEYGDQEVLYYFDLAKKAKTREGNAVYYGLNGERKRSGRL